MKHEDADIRRICNTIFKLLKDQPIAQRSRDRRIQRRMRTELDVKITLTESFYRSPQQLYWPRRTMPASNNPTPDHVVMEGLGWSAHRDANYGNGSGIWHVKGNRERFEHDVTMWRMKGKW